MTCSKVSPSSLPAVVLGSVFFGTQIARDASYAVMDTYLEGGGNFIDTANGYALWLPEGVGASERTIGEWMRARGLRDQIVLATKGAHFRPDGAPGHCSREQIEDHLTQSLERLAVETVDLYWLHRDEPARPVGEIIETLADIRRSGRIRAYGASNWEPDRIEAANQYAEAHHLPRFVASQPASLLGT